MRHAHGAPALYLRSITIERLDQCPHYSIIRHRQEYLDSNTL